MSRWLLIVVLAPTLASCATGSDEPIGAMRYDASAGETGALDGATEDVSGGETGALDAASDAPAADTTVGDGTALETSVVADTSVADTFVADTFVADTFVADTPPADGGPCSGTIVDWNWNTGTGPTTTLVTSGKTWAVGTATSGPSDGLTYLATIASGSIYPNSANDWVRLPTLDLNAYKTCKVRVTVTLWRNAEKYGLVNYDGGNLQYTTDPTAASGWGVMDGGSMAYDGNLTCTSCLVAGQKVWTSSASPFVKTGTFTSSAALGASLSLRFTFYSDSDGALPGIFVKRVLIEAVP